MPPPINTDLETLRKKLNGCEPDNKTKIKEIIKQPLVRELNDIQFENFIRDIDEKDKEEIRIYRILARNSVPQSVLDGVNQRIDFELLERDFRDYLRSINQGGGKLYKKKKSKRKKKNKSKRKSKKRRSKKKKTKRR